jgi:hypothetical protein
LISDSIRPTRLLGLPPADRPLNTSRFLRIGSNAARDIRLDCLWLIGFTVLLVAAPQLHDQLGLDFDVFDEQHARLGSCRFHGAGAVGESSRAASRWCRAHFPASASAFPPGISGQASALRLGAA